MNIHCGDITITGIEPLNIAHGEYTFCTKFYLELNFEGYFYECYVELDIYDEESYLYQGIFSNLSGSSVLYASAEEAIENNMEKISEEINEYMHKCYTDFTLIDKENYLDA